MSRIGKKAVPVPKGVTASVTGQAVKVKGPKGELKFPVRPEVEVKLDGATLTVAARDEERNGAAAGPEYGHAGQMQQQEGNDAHPVDAAQVLRSAGGKRYRDAAPWKLAAPMPADAAERSRWPGRNRRVMIASLRKA